MKKIKEKILSVIHNFVIERKAIHDLENENKALMEVKNEISANRVVYDVDFPTINTPFDLIEFKAIEEFSIINESVIIVTTPYERLTLTIIDNEYLIGFLKRVFTACNVSTIDREKLLLSKGLDFYLTVNLDVPVDVKYLRGLIHSGTWFIRDESTTYDLPEEEPKRPYRVWE